MPKATHSLLYVSAIASTLLFGCASTDTTSEPTYLDDGHLLIVHFDEATYVYAETMLRTVLVKHGFRPVTGTNWFEHDAPPKQESRFYGQISLEYSNRLIFRTKHEYMTNNNSWYHDYLRTLFNDMEQDARAKASSDRVLLKDTLPNEQSIQYRVEVVLWH